jgi:uncharacterized protein (DUF2132 family)
MNTEQPRNPLHGVKLEQIVTDLVESFGWEVLADQINLNCFKADPSIKSSLKFLRKTPWAREKIESLYLYAIVRGKPLRSQADYQADYQAKFQAKTRSQSKPAARSAAPNSNIWKNPA